MSNQHSNRPEATYLKQIEELIAALESERGDFMAKCKQIRADIKGVYREAKEDNIKLRPLKGLVRYRVLQRKQAAIVRSMPADDLDEYEELIETLGELGRAAVTRAKRERGARAEMPA